MRRIAVLLTVAALALLAAGTSGAERARQVTIDISDTFTSDFWSAQCGFDVVIEVSGELHVTLVYNGAGLIVLEIDRAGGSKIIWTAPSHPGKTFSYPNAQPSRWDYGSGATVGSAVTITFSGLSGHVPGAISSDAGLLVFTGAVEGFDEFGIPEVEFTDQIAQKGHFSDLANIRAAICGTLAGP